MRATHVKNHTLVARILKIGFAQINAPLAIGIVIEIGIEIGIEPSLLRPQELHFHNKKVYQSLDY